MTFKATLVRSVALGSVLAVALGATAQAKPVKKHHHHHAAAAAANPNAELLAEVQALRSEVRDLHGRLDAQAQTTQQAQSQAEAAQAQAAAAQQQVQVATADIKRIPAEVKQEVAAAAPKPVSGWWSNTSVNGRMYFNLSNIDQKTNTGVPATTGKVPPSGTGFDIKRFYVGIDHKFNDIYSANLTMDMQYSSAIGATEFYIKKAYLQAAYSPALTVRLGSTDLPWIPFVEDVYGYRYVEQTLTDRTKFGTSADWGAHVLGKVALADKMSLGYQVSLVNGAGYKTPGMPGSGAQGRTKTMDLEGRVNLNVDKFVFALGGYDGKLGKNPTVAPPGVPPVLHTAERFNALAAYVDPKFRVGVEYFTAKDWGVTTVDKADGYSGWASFNFAPNMSIFGRYDYEKPNKTTAPTKKDGYWNLGLSYSPAKIVDLSLVYKRDKVDNGSLSTGNGTIGGAVGGTYDEIGLFGQFRW